MRGVAEKAAHGVEPVLLAWSGGKDSALALAALRNSPRFKVAGLLTSVTQDYDRISIHGVRRSILKAQSACLGLPVFEAELAPGADNRSYEMAWTNAIELAKDELGIRSSVVAYGDIFLEDVRRYREGLASRLGHTLIFPLWGMNTAELAKRALDLGYEAYVSCVDTTQLSASFAGRRYDYAFLADLPASVDPCGERGEFHTCVVGGPGFGARIEVTLGECVLRENRFQFCDLVPAIPT